MFAKFLISFVTFCSLVNLGDLHGKYTYRKFSLDKSLSQKCNFSMKIHKFWTNLSLFS
jgi:hypothetical protein